MSADLVKRWRKLSREHYETAVAIEQGRLPSASASEAPSTRAYGEALRRCADSLERSLTIQARKARKAASK